MRVLGQPSAAAGIALDLGGVIDKLARPRDHGDGANLLLETIDRAEHLESQLRQAVPELCKSHPLKDDIGDAAIGWGQTRPLLAFNQAVGLLRLRPRIKPERNVAETEFLAVRPHLADARDRAFAQGHGEVGEVAVGGLRRAAPAAAQSLATAAATGIGNFLEAGGPDHFAGDPCTAVKPRDRRALTRGHNLQRTEPWTIQRQALTAGAEQRLVDERASNATNRLTDRGARQRGAEKARRRQQCAADGRPDGGEGKCGHDVLA